MSSVSPDAVLASVTTATVVFGAALWKLATMLAEVRAQIRHNGGDSLKDNAKDAKDVAVALARRLDASEGRATEDRQAMSRQLDRISETQAASISSLTFHFRDIERQLAEHVHGPTRKHNARAEDVPE